MTIVRRFINGNCGNLPAACAGTMGRMRRGDEVISPEDQAYIRKVFTQFGQGVEPEFKGFEAHYVKPPRRK